MSTTPAKPKATSPRTTRATHAPEIWHERWFHLVMWLVLFVLLILFLDAVRAILLPFVLAGIIAYLMDPLADWLEARKIHRGMASAGITILLFTTATALCIWIGPLLYHQFIDLLARTPELIREIELALRDETASFFLTLNHLNGSNDTPSGVGELLQRSFAAAGALATRVLASAASVLNVLALLLITPIVCFYAIRDWDTVLARLDTLLPRAYAPTIREQLHRINLTLAAYLRGQLTVMLLLAIYYALLFTVVGLKYAILLGLLSGLLVIIPYVGTWISVLLGSMIAYSQFGITTPFYIIIAIYAVGQVLETQILTPKIVGDRVGVHPLWLLFGMLAGGVLLGFVGVLLAVPLTAVISVLVKFIVERYLHSTLYTDK